jgi:hypothetical protein
MLVSRCRNRWPTQGCNHIDNTLYLIGGQQVLQKSQHSMRPTRSHGRAGLQVWSPHQSPNPRLMQRVVSSKQAAAPFSRQKSVTP